MTLLLGTALCAAAPVPEAVSGAPLTTERQAQLLRMLRQDCGSCHGLTMKGGLGAPLLPAALDGKSDEALIAVILGLGRALGETMAVTMVIGNTPKASLSLFAPQYTMAAVIANEFSEAADQLHLDSLVEIERIAAEGRGIERRRLRSRQDRLHDRTATAKATAWVRSWVNVMRTSVTPSERARAASSGVCP